MYTCWLVVGVGVDGGSWRLWVGGGRVVGMADEGGLGDEDREEGMPCKDAVACLEAK